MKKINLKIIAVFITSFCLLNSCQKSETKEESFNRLEKTYNVKFSTNVLKIAIENQKNDNFEQINDLENDIKLHQNKSATSKILEPKKKVNRLKIMDYTYAQGELGEGGGDDPFYSGNFEYANPVGITIFTVSPYYSFNSTTKTFSNFGVSVSGNTGQYSASLVYMNNSNLGLYHRVYVYKVTITRNFVYQGLPTSVSTIKYYNYTVNRNTGALIGISEQ